MEKQVIRLLEPSMKDDPIFPNRIENETEGFLVQGPVR